MKKAKKRPRQRKSGSGPRNKKRSGRAARGDPDRVSRLVHSTIRRATHGRSEVDLEFAFDRPDDSVELARAASRDTNCLECGNCCRTNKGLIIFDDDENLAAILEAIKTRRIPQSALTRTTSSWVLTPHRKGGCHFFDDETSGCSIYHIRPRSCNVYPYVIGLNFAINVGARQLPVVHLNLECPPIKELKARGVPSLFGSDVLVLSCKAPEGEIVDPSTISESIGFLGFSLRAVLESHSRDETIFGSKLYGAPPFISVDSDLIIPIV